MADSSAETAPVVAAAPQSVMNGSLVPMYCFFVASVRSQSCSVALGCTGRQVEHVDEDRIAYRVGNHVAIVPKEGSGMRFVFEERGVKSTGRFAISPNLRYMACSEKVGGSVRV